MNDLREIGFYTLSDKRAAAASEKTPLHRCELILTGRCSFNCAYCRGIGGPNLPLDEAKNVVDLWADEGLVNIRFSGGEPTIYPHLPELVSYTADRNVKRIAISTNGASSVRRYQELVDAGVTDFSVSLDACCAAEGDQMAGGRKGAFNRVVENIKRLSERVYVTVGVVLTPDNKSRAEDIIQFADTLGVSDIRVIPAAQDGQSLPTLNLEQRLLNKHPILRYRTNNLRNGRSVRGIEDCDVSSCGLVLDDMAVMGGWHYPCIIYLRESGDPIGRVGPNMRKERAQWYRRHNSRTDPICRMNCLDVCRDYNCKHAKARMCDSPT